MQSLRWPVLTAWRVAVAVALLWLAMFAKVGSGLSFGIDETMGRVRAFPRLIISGNALSDYRNWSVLPLALGRAVGADSARSFAVLQAVLLLAGTVAIIGGVARRRPVVALGALTGLFSTMVPAWLLNSMGSYDQLLVVLLLGAVLVDRRWAAIGVGLLLGVTHAEAAVASLFGLTVLSAARVGPRTQLRYWTLVGVVTSRLALTIWFRAAGQSGDRFTFISEFGVSKLIGFFLDTWPCILWSAACGGWLILASRAVCSQDRRLARAIGAALLVNLVATALTADQSRIVMITTMPLVVALAAFRDTYGDDKVRSVYRFADRGALVIGMLAPLTISWVGEIAIAGDPLRLRW